MMKDARCTHDLVLLGLVTFAATADTTSFWSTLWTIVGYNGTYVDLAEIMTWPHLLLQALGAYGGRCRRYSS